MPSILKTKSDEEWIGRERASFATNALLHAPPLGAPRKTTFAPARDDIVFGAKAKGDAEGAKEVIFSWAEHSAAATAAHATATAIATTTTYGRPPGYRSAEECRTYGPPEPRMKDLLSGSFAREWVDANAARAARRGAPDAGAIAPRTTRAAEGHRSGALARLAPAAGASGGGGAGGGGGWKMPRFLRTAAPRVTAYMGGGRNTTTASSSAKGAGGGGGGEEEGAAATAAAGDYGEEGSGCV